MTGPMIPTTDPSQHAHDEADAIVAEHMRCALEATRTAHTHLAESVHNGGNFRQELHDIADLQRRLALFELRRVEQFYAEGGGHPAERLSLEELREQAGA